MSIENKFKYDIDFQILRVNCLKKYSITGGWQTLKGLSHNCQKLNRYLDDQSNLGLWRVKKLLTPIRASYIYTLNTENLTYLDQYIKDLPKVNIKEDYSVLSNGWWQLQRDKIYSKPYNSIVKVRNDLNRRSNNKDKDIFLDIIGVYLWIK